jgi:hypothetical protein
MSSNSPNYFTPHSSSNSLSAAEFSNSGVPQPPLYYPPPPLQAPPQHRKNDVTGRTTRPSYQKQQQRTIATTTSSLSATHSSGTGRDHNPFTRIQSPPAPPVSQLPDRFLRAGKGDVTEGTRRYRATLDWRRQYNIDGILLEAHPMFGLIKHHYPHFYHGRGYKNEPVFFEQPPKTNLQALKAAGVDLDGLVRHYTMVTEFQWQFIEPSDQARSITVLDLDGIRMMDFVGEWYVEFCLLLCYGELPLAESYVRASLSGRYFVLVFREFFPPCIAIFSLSCTSYP